MLSKSGHQDEYDAEEIRRLLHRKALAAELHRAGVARELGVTDTEAAALAHLAGHGQLTPSELAGLLGLTSGGTTALLQRLIRAGHIDRHPHPADRRSILISVSAQTVARASEIYAPLVDATNAVIERYDASELRTVRRFLTDIVAVAEDQAAALDMARRRSCEDAVAVPEPALWA